MSKLTDFLPKFAPLDGVGTSGTWPISITGNATTVPDMVYLNAKQTVTNKTLTKPVVEGLIEGAVALTGNVIEIDKGAVFTKTITGNAALSVTGSPPLGQTASFILTLTNGGSAVITWWPKIRWNKGKVPILTADGTDNLGFYTHDGGATWDGFLLSQDSKFAPVWVEGAATSAGANLWFGVASSADGMRLVASVYSSGYIYTSKDGGATWIERTSAGLQSWGGVASSADGMRLVAGSYGGGYVYTSTDGGATWIERTSAGAHGWYFITSSADGMRLAAVDGTNYIYTSTDGGATWVERTSAGSRSWDFIATSADGMRLAAAALNGYIYTSTDGGATWIERTSAGVGKWFGVASSADGMRLVAGSFFGYIYTSKDGGATWIERTSAGANLWFGVASSADGRRLAAADHAGYIHLLSNS